MTTPLEDALEVQIELDERWSTVQVIQAAEKDWRHTMLHMTGKLAQANFGAEHAYNVRETQMKPSRIWSSRMRLQMPVAERLLCRSGHDALFCPTSSSASSTSG